MKLFALIKWLWAVCITLSAMAYVVFTRNSKKPYDAVKAGGRFISRTLKINFEIIGKEDKEANMFIMNHQSELDIVIMENVTDANIAWVAKKELFDIPFFGRSLKIPNNIPVERQSKSSLVKLIKDVKTRLDDGRTIAIFPEGTRSTTGKLRKFQPGAKMVADKYGLRVQPVVIIESASFFGIKSRTYKSGTCKVVFLDSFIASKDDKEWLNNTRELMQKTYDEHIEKR